METHNPADDAAQASNTADTYYITFTELAAQNAKFVGKGIYKKTGQIADYPQVKHWRQKRVTVGGVEELARYLEGVAYPKPGFSVCLIRGEAGPGAKDSILRRKTQDPSDNLFRDTPSRFVVFDVDGAELGDGFDWTADPKAAVHSIVERLGEPFVRCSYVTILSGTHGLKKDSKGFWTGEFDRTKVKFKLFVVAERAVDTVELKTWSLMLKAALTAVDPSQSNSAVQPIYVARPMVYGGDGKDVLAQFNIPVCWLHRGEIDLVPPPTELRREVRFNRAEGNLDIVAPHPNADAALRAVGKPSKNAGDIYAHLRAAAQHLAREQEIDLADKQAVAEAATRIINTLRERVSEFRDQITENLGKSGRGWDEIEEYLADGGDVYRWILWCFDHPGSLKPKRKTIERLTVEPRPQLPPPQPGLLERIRQQLKDEVAQFIDIVMKAYEGGGFTATENGPAPYRPPQRLLSFPIGAGKSTESRTAGVSFVDRFVEGATVVYALPRHQLGDEQVASLAREHPGVRAAVWRGMQAVDPHYPPDPLAPRKTMCWRTDDVLDMRDACLSATDLCQQGRGEDARRCAFFDECGYQRQKGQDGAQVWFMAHEMLVHEKPKALGSPVLLFIDENPIDAFLVGVEAEFSVPLGALTKGKPISKRAVEARDGADGDEAELSFWNAELFRVLSELPDGPVPRSAMEFLTPERCARMYKLQWRHKVEVEIDPRWTGDRLKAALVPAANNKTMKKLAALWKTLGEALKPGGPALMGRVRLGWCSITNTRKVFLCGVQGPCEPWDKVPTIVMDATGSIEMLQTVWPEMTERRCTEEIVTPFVAIEQVVDRAFGKHYCAPERPDAIDNENDGDAAKARLAIEVYASVMAQAIRYGCHDAGLITYLKTELCIRNNCVVPPWLSLTHYGCESGTNSLEKVRMLALVGRPLPQYGDVVRRAEALFAEGVVGEERGYVQVTDTIRTKADAVGRNAIAVKQWRAVHANAEKVRRAICETALVQAVGRVRPLQRTAEAPVTVILFTDTPVEELGDVIPRLWAEMRPSQDEVTLARHGFMLANSVDAANAAPDVVKSAAALKMDRQKRYRLQSEKHATQQGGLSSGSPSTQTDESNFSLMENLLKEKVTHCPPPEEQVAPQPQPEIPIDVVVYQKAGARYKPATAVRLNVGMSSSEWLIQTVGPLASFDRMTPPIGEGGHQILTNSYAMPQQMGTGTTGTSARFSATLRSD